MYEQTMNNDLTMTGGENPLLAGRYQVVRQLGTGGMGSVWLAEDTQLDNKLFAVKMLPAILVSNKRAYRQLKDEALVAMRLVHPNIVQIRAFEENSGNPFLVMDYIEGQTLDDYLAEKGKLSEEETIRLLKPIAAALDYAHGEGVVHRDVKPANIMIRKDGHPYILDFGIAREIQETMTRVTGKLSSGTLLYMSPEQLRGQPPKAVQDVYSFAAMVYECLKGEPPFSRGQIEYQILNEKPAPLPDGVKLSASIMRGLSKEPETRPDSCASVLFIVVVAKPSPRIRAQASIQPSRVPPVVAKPQAPQKSSVPVMLIPIVCIIIALVAIGSVMWHRDFQRKEEARKRAVAAQQAEAARQRQEEEARQAKEAAEKKEQEDRKKEAAERKVREAELQRQEQERERELARQQVEARKAEEAKQAAEAAKAKAESDKAMALQREKNALELLARDPLQYESVSMDFTKEHRELLSPLYDEVVRGEAYLKDLLEKYTELNPKVVGARKEQNFRVANFKSVVKTLQNGNQPSALFASPTERFDDYVVKAGDSFAKIAISHGTSIAALKELNGLDDVRLRVGQKIRVPQIKNRNTNIASPKKGSDEFVGSQKKSFAQDSSFVRCDDIIFTPVYFDANEVQIRPNEVKTIALVSEHLTHTDCVLIIDGHGDTGVAKERGYKLGELRAAQVKARMEAFGVSAEKIQVRNWGSDKPAVMGQNENAQRFNRRCEFIVFKPKNSLSHEHPNPSSKTEEFIKAFQERRFLAAAELINVVDHSDSVVQYNIAFMYLSGLGTAQNREEGLKWLRRSAEQGYAAAQTDLGIHYFHGEGIEKNLDKAKTLFVQAAEQGNAEAQRMIGGMYVYGIGTKRDRSKGMEFLRKAANQGDVKAKEALSELGEK